MINLRWAKFTVHACRCSILGVQLCCISSTAYLHVTYGQHSSLGMRITQLSCWGFLAFEARSKTEIWRATANHAQRESVPGFGAILITLKPRTMHHQAPPFGLFTCNYTIEPGPIITPQPPFSPPRSSINIIGLLEERQAERRREASLIGTHRHKPLLPGRPCAVRCCSCRSIASLTASSSRPHTRPSHTSGGPQLETMKSCAMAASSPSQETASLHSNTCALS